MPLTLARRRPVLAATTLVLAALAAPAATQAAITPVATGLDNPRGLALGPDGTLYVAIAGTGGSGPCVQDPEEGRTCFGSSSKIVAIKDGAKTTIAKGVFSAAAPDGSFGAGIDGVSVGPDGAVYGIVSSGTKTQVRSLPKKWRAQAGGIVKVNGGQQSLLPSVSPFEWANNVDGVKNDRNSNPYGILALADGRLLIADAGANAIFQVKDGQTSLFAVIPPLPHRQQPVPTSLAVGPDGAIYVGELAFGGGPGGANVVRIPATGGTATVFAKGFTAISGLAFAPDGSMYVTELTLDIEKGKPGDVIKVAPDGRRTTLGGKGELIFPTGAAADASGVYVSNFSTLPAKTPKKSDFHGAGGMVVKITP